MTKQPFHPFRSEQARTEFRALYLERAKAWPVPWEARLVDTPSGQTFVRASGRIEDPPLVLLSGARGTSLMWIPNIAALSANHRIYALDTITDIGLSVARAEITGPEDLVKWLDEVLAVLVPEGRLDLMGMSYGGWLAGQYALRFPDRLRTVVLLAPGATVLPMSLGFLIRIALIAIPFPGRHGTAVHRMIRWLFQDLVRKGDAGRGPAGMGVADVIAAIELDRFFALPWMIWPTVIDDEAWRRFTVPGLFLVGENEKIYSGRAAVRRLNRVAPRMETEIVPGAGHDLTLVQADLVTERVLRFLADPPGDGQTKTPD